MANKASSMLTAAGIVVLFIAVICVGGYFAIVQYVADSQNQAQDNQEEPATQTPPTDATTNWNVINNSVNGFSLKYPNDFFDVGHEPKMLSSGVSTNCNQPPTNECPDIAWLIGNSVNAKLTNSNVMVNNVHYCQYQASDAAAGHRYYSDYYITLKNQECFAVELDTSETVCDNYLPIQSGNAEQEKNYNACVAHRDSRTSVLQQIVNTFTFTNAVK